MFERELLESKNKKSNHKLKRFSNVQEIDKFALNQKIDIEDTQELFNEQSRLLNEIENLRNDIKHLREVNSQKQLQWVLDRHSLQLLKTLKRLYHNDVLAQNVIANWNIMCQKFAQNRRSLILINQKRLELREQIEHMKRELNNLQAHNSSLEFLNVQESFYSNSKKEVVFSLDFESRKTQKTDEFDKLKRISKYLKSSIFTNEVNSLYENWKLQMQNKLKANKNWWSSKSEQIRVILFWTDEKISRHLNVRRRYNFDVFEISRNVFDILNEIFKDSNSQRNARTVYNELRMKSEQIFVDFYVEFILLINQLKNCFEKIKMKNLKNKIITTLRRATANSDFFRFLKKYKNHLQITNVRLRNLRLVSKSILSKDTEKESDRFSKSVVRIVETLSRTLSVAIKTQISLKNQIIKNLTRQSIKCFDCKNSHFLKNCLNFDQKEKEQWV